MVSTGPPNGPSPGQEFQTDPFSDPFSFPDEQCSDLAGGSNVSPAACAVVDVSYCDQSESAPPIRWFPESRSLFSFLEAHLHRSVFDHDLVGPLPRPVDLVLGELAGLQVQCRGFRPKVNRDGLVAEQVG